MMQIALRTQLQAAQDKQSATGTANPIAEGKPGEFTGTGVIRLRVADVLAYEDNPRQASNAKYPEILESIRSRGLDQQLTVTKRPGQSQYILARGGRTRLMALQELASQGDERFEQMDFLVVPYKSDSDLLAAHMVENLSRQDMTFWDTARGFLLLRQKRVKELGKDIPLRDFAAELKKQGLEADKAALSDFDFLLNTLGKLGEPAKALSRNDVRNLLRPQFLQLEAWRAQSMPQRSLEALEGAYASWLAQIGQQHEAQAAPQEMQEMGAQRIHDAVYEHAAQWFGFEDSAALLAALHAAPGGSGTQGRASKAQAPATALPSPTTLPLTPGLGGDAGGGDEDGHDNDAAGDTPWMSSAAGAGDGAGDSAGDSAGDAAGDGASDSAGGGGIAALPGVRVAPAASLTPIPYGKAAGGQTASEPSTQAALGGLSPLETARTQLQAAIDEMAREAAVSHCLRPAPRMPYGYIMEIPPTPLGASMADLGAQGWWFLAIISGQFHFLQQTGPDQQPLVPDGGPTGFRACASSAQTWQPVQQQLLGDSSMLTDAALMFSLLSDPHNPLCELALQVLSAARQYRLYATQEMGS